MEFTWPIAYASDLLPSQRPHLRAWAWQPSADARVFDLKRREASPTHRCSVSKGDSDDSEEDSHGLEGRAFLPWPCR
jgi:hypothetical protein